MTNNTPVKLRTNNVGLRKALLALAVAFNLPRNGYTYTSEDADNAPFVTLNRGGEFHFSASSSSNDNNCSEVTYERFIEVLNGLRAAPEVSVPLKGGYSAVVSAAGIVVGCQTFPLEIIDALVKAARDAASGAAKNTNLVKIMTSDIALRKAIIALAKSQNIAIGNESGVDYASYGVVTFLEDYSVNFSGRHSHNDSICTEVTLDKFLTAMLAEKKPAKIEVKLNSSYAAVVTKETVEAGGYRFPITVIDQLVKARNEVKQ